MATPVGVARRQQAEIDAVTLTMTCTTITRLEARLPPNVGFSLHGDLAITPPKVNRFG